MPSGSTQSLLLGGFGRRDVVASAYFQDDMKLTRRLTVNAGVRWDLWTPWVEVHDRQTNFNLRDRPTRRRIAQRSVRPGAARHELAQLRSAPRPRLRPDR